MKCCIKCNTTKPLEQFAKRSKGVFRNECKVCRNNKVKERVYLITTTEQECFTCKKVLPINNFHRNSRRKNGVVETCKKCRKVETQEFYNKNKEKVKNKTKQYYYKNKDKVRVTKREYSKFKRQTDLVYKLTRNLRNRLYYALKRTSWKKETHFSQYIGCSLEDLKTHISSKFLEGMTWDNYGKWHIDHIIPLSKANTDEELYKLCHYTNLAPVWAAENISKNNSLVYTVKPISKQDTLPYLLEIHYAKRVPNIKYSFGLFANDLLVGVVTYGPPTGPSTAKALVGEEYKSNVLELNRLCLKNNLKNEASFLVSKSLKLLPRGTIVLSFADKDQGHIGYVYQATNFKYYGTTEPKREVALKSDPTRHALSIYDESEGVEDRAQFLKDKYGDDIYYKTRSVKHRYVFITGNNRNKYSIIKYTPQPYPKI